jgi:hypothetical protein
MGARSTAASVVRHVGGVAVEALLVAALIATVALVFSPVYAPAKFLSGTETTLAAKGGHAGAKATGATITVPDGTFGGTTTAITTPGLYVYASCSQGSTVVYTQYKFTDASGDAVLTLGPTPMWTGGSATCKAQAGSFSNSGAWRSQGSTTFNVSG